MANEILIVDDEADIRVLTSGILEDEGYQTRDAANSSEALAAVEARRPSMVLLDIWLQGSELDGLGILKALKENHPTIPVLMMSGHGTIETAVTAIQDGAYDFIEKPFKAARLIQLVERAIEADSLRRENEELRLRAGTANELIGVSQAAIEMRQAIDRMAPSNSRVLITGPAGSVTVHNCRVIHGSAINHSDAGRPLLLNVYSAADACPYTANPLKNRFEGEIVRGKAARWARHDPRPCEMPPDWSDGYVSIYAVQQEEEVDEDQMKIISKQMAGIPSGAPPHDPDAIVAE